MVNIPIEQLNEAEKAVLMELHLRMLRLDNGIVKEAMGKRSSISESILSPLVEKGYIKYAHRDYYKLTDEGERLTKEFYSNVIDRQKQQNQPDVEPEKIKITMPVLNQFPIIWKIDKKSRS